MTKQLENGCSYTELWVSPPNWKKLTDRKSLELNWYVQCKFYDPLFKDKYPNGFPFRKKLNKYKSLQQRKDIAQLLLKEIPRILEEEGYNPITKKSSKIKVPPKVEVLNPDLPILEAFYLVKEKLKSSEKHKKEITFALNRFAKAVKQLRMDEITIGKFRRSELKTILEYLDLTDNYFNKFRAYLSSLFNELIEYDCCEINLTRDIRKRKITKNIREVLEIENLRKILKYMELNQPEFFRYANIFFYSGARSSELLRLQKKEKEVDLAKQEYKIIIKKGRQYTETIKVILPAALPFWAEILQEAKANDYLFSRKLKPGAVAISSTQITRRWNRHVKQKLAFFGGEICEIQDLKSRKIENYKRITADFYCLKHLFLDILDEERTENLDENLAKTAASHTSDTTTSIYTTKRKLRERETLKKNKTQLLSNS